MTNIPQGPGSPEQEEIVFEGRLPLKAFIGRQGLLYLLLLGWNVGLLIAMFQRLSWHLRLSNQRLVIVRGIISQKEEEVPLYRATDCSYRQTIAGRLLGTGEITLLADDQTSPETLFPMPSPRLYKERLREFIVRQRQQMRSMNMD